MAGEEACQVCQEPHSEARPGGLQFSFAAATDLAFTGPEEVLRQDYVTEQ